MEPIVTSSEMRACDRYAIEVLKIPALVLMENAGRGAAEVIERSFGPVAGKTVLIFCGKGNNGGDGFVIARHLYNRGANIYTLVLGKPTELKGDPKVNFDPIREISKRAPKDRVFQIKIGASKSSLSMLPKADLIVDAIFGTGFSGIVKEPQRSVINWINDSDTQVVSVDIPSGVNADTGEVANVAVKANLTATMAFKKIGLITGDGISYTGKIEVVDISIPKSIAPQDKIRAFLLDSTDVKSMLPKRPLNAHKHSVGKLFVIAGSQGMTGAATMTALSAMRSGAGTVIVGVPKAVYPIVAKKLTEVMVIPLPDTADGTIASEAYDEIIKHIDWADKVICGPGVSRNRSTRELIWRIGAECPKDMLIDADGLNCISEKISVLSKRKSRHLIITPHVGELSRLIDMPSKQIETNRVAVARQVAKRFKLTLVLKGAPTVIADESGNVFINSTGNPGMASAGMGDVLAGVIGGLWGQGMSHTEAAWSGVYLHGMAGDVAKQKYGEKGLMAMDVLQNIPEVIQQIEKSNLL
jgi:ADP-dependent NAD(P)H-hydrate dehydratase / NAD(P)H-hydrate epimerase